jgi:hypothetical protein
MSPNCWDNTAYHSSLSFTFISVSLCSWDSSSADHAASSELGASMYLVPERKVISYTFGAGSKVIQLPFMCFYLQPCQ